MTASNPPTASFPHAHRFQARADDAAGVDRLWAQYTQAPDAQSRAAARALLVQQFERLAYSIANRFAHRPVLGGDHEDLVQVALVGLVKAIDRFDPSTGYQFSTFATPTILGELKRHFRDHTWHLHVPRGLQELVQHVFHARASLSERWGREPTPAEIAAHLGVTEDEVQRALDLDASNMPLSLDREFERPDESRPAVLEQYLGSEDRDLHAAEARVSVGEALERLPLLLQQVIRMRFFMELSQREAGRRLGLSQMRVCRLEHKALELLRCQFQVH